MDFTKDAEIRCKELEKELIEITAETKKRKSEIDMEIKDRKSNIRKELSILNRLLILKGVRKKKVKVKK